MYAAHMMQDDDAIELEAAHTEALVTNEDFDYYRDYFATYDPSDAEATWQHEMKLAAAHEEALAINAALDALDTTEYDQALARLEAAKTHLLVTVQLPARHTVDKAAEDNAYQIVGEACWILGEATAHLTNKRQAITHSAPFYDHPVDQESMFVDPAV